MPQQTAPSADHPLDSLGLQDDLRRMAALEAPDRRRAMTWLAALGGGSLLGATGLSGCGGGGDAATSSSTSGNGTVTATSSSGEVCSVIPTETQGPYPGDGSNSADNKLLTSQMAFPTEACEAVYDTASGYSASVNNLAQISFASDNVFSDGHDTQMLSITGDVGSGYVATITVGMSV